MSDTRHKNVQWNLGSIENGCTYEQVKMALLMDIRDELQKLNALLGCPNFIRIPRILDDIKFASQAKRKYTRKTK